VHRDVVLLAHRGGVRDGRVDLGDAHVGRDGGVMTSPLQQRGVHRLREELGVVDGPDPREGAERRRVCWSGL
jgi:hypothetical protein